MSDDTRGRILEEGARLIHRQGFNNTGIKQVLDASGVPKGSFYFYFPSKEAFGLAVVDHYEERFRGVAMGILLAGDGGPLARLRAFFLHCRGFFESEGWQLGCPIGNLAQELGDTSPVFRQRLDTSIRGLRRVIARVLTEAKGAGELPPELDPEATAMFMVEAWHGALISMKAAKSGEPLDVCHEMLFTRILGVPWD